LSLMQKRFLKYYLMDPTNAAEAARKAGYSPKTAAKKAHLMLKAKNTPLLPYLEQAASTGELEIGMSETDLFNMLEGMATVNMFDFINVSGGRTIEVKSLEDIPYDWGQYVRKVEETAHGIRIEFYDKSKPIDMLLRAKGAYSKDNEQKASLTIEEYIKKVRDDEKGSDPIQ